jgi:hypothetical protein
MTTPMEQHVADFKKFGPDDQKELLKKTISAADEKAAKDALSSPEVQDKVASLQGATQQASNILWFVIFGILTVVIIGGGIVGVVASGSDETAIFGFVGIALGAVVGLVAPSPKLATR